MISLFSIPLKRTAQLNLKEELSTVINNTFYQTAASFEQDLIKIDKLREVLFHFDVSSKNLEELISYYLVLKTLSKKFPDDQIGFTWFNTLGFKSSGMTKNSLKFEMYNVLYNIGAMNSLLAVDLYEESNKGIKEACKTSKLAAGCFQYILDADTEENLKFFEDYTLRSLVSMMLAQAQEMVWRKALNDDDQRHSLLSRLALQIALFYETSSRNANISSVIRTDWVKQLKIKHQYFMGVSFYRSACHQLEKQNYAQGITDLKEALTWVNKIPKDDEIIVWKERINTMLKSAERDNDLIYLQPEIITPSIIKPVNMVKCETFPEIDLKDNFILKNLLPIDIIETATAFNERVENYVDENITQPLRSLDKLLLQALPEGESSEQPEVIIEDEWKSYLESFEDIKHLDEYATDKLNSLNALLKHESEEVEKIVKNHESFRNTFESTISTSEQLTSDLKRIKDYIDEGRRVNEETFSLFNTLDHSILTDSSLLPESNNPRIKEIELVKREREKYIVQTRNKILENRLLPKIITHYKQTESVDFEPLYQEHIRIFDSDLAYIQQQKAKNREIIASIEAAQSPKKQVKRLDPRQLYFEELKHSLEILSEVKNNIMSGKQFYEDLIVALDIKKQSVTQYLHESEMNRVKLGKSL